MYYYQWKQKEAPKLAVEGNMFFSRSIITTLLLPFLAWWLRNPIPVPRVISWPTITKTDSTPHFHAYTSVQQGVSLKTGLKHFCYLKVAAHFMCSKKLTNKKQKIFSEKQKGFRDGLPSKMWRNKGKCHYPALVPSIMTAWQAIPKSFLFFRENFLLLVCEVFRAHERHSQLEVTEMLECKVN